MPTNTRIHAQVVSGQSEPGVAVFKAGYRGSVRFPKPLTLYHQKLRMVSKCLAISNQLKSMSRPVSHYLR